MLLDTCVLLWWTLDRQKLSAAAEAACQSVERDGGFVSSISLWELGLKIKRGKLDIGMPIGQYVQLVAATNLIEVLNDDATVWLENLDLDWAHPDPADRTIVATAKLR